MDRRLKKMGRILKVRERLHQLEELRLANLDREHEELKHGQEVLVAALNQDEPLHGLFVEAMARRLNALARETDRVNRALDVQTRRLFEEGLSLKRTERMTDKVRREYLKDAWKRGFEDLLETPAGRDDASFP
jgi:hypothetical protein